VIKPKPSTSTLRRRVTVQSRSTVKDGFGQELAEWTDVATVWAAIHPMVGGSQVSGAAEVAEITHLVFVRFLAGVTARMRLQYGAREFEIVSIIDRDEGHVWLELQCSEGLTQG
jgi:SPP1 family predicted phage head-tail adaptor